MLLTSSSPLPTDELQSTSASHFRAVFSSTTGYELGQRPPGWLIASTKQAVVAATIMAAQRSQQ